MPALLSSDVSDEALLALAALSQRTGVPGEYLLEVFNSETNFKPLNPADFRGTRYYGPAAMMESLVKQVVDPAAFARMGLAERIGYLDKMVKEQVKLNRGLIPNRAAVYYALNFVPAAVYSAGGNPPDSTVLAPTGSQYWKDNPAFHPYADSSGITIGTLGRVLSQKRMTNGRLIELLGRYKLLTSDLPLTVSKKSALGLIVGLGVLGGVGYYLFKKLA